MKSPTASANSSLPILERCCEKHLLFWIKYYEIEPANAMEIECVCRLSGYEPTITIGGKRKILDSFFHENVTHLKKTKPGIELEWSFEDDAIHSINAMDVDIDEYDMIDDEEGNTKIDIEMAPNVQNAQINQQQFHTKETKRAFSSKTFGCSEQHSVGTVFASASLQAQTNLSGSTVNSPPFNYSSGSGAEERHHNDFEEVVEEEEVLDEGYVEPKQSTGQMQLHNRGNIEMAPHQESDDESQLASWQIDDGQVDTDDDNEAEYEVGPDGLKYYAIN